MSEYYSDKHRYDDIISMPHHQSNTKAHMSLHDRAAQFAPFAALTGHKEAIEETGRLTEDKIILDDMQIEKINQKLYEIANDNTKEIKVAITYFKEDKLKLGGSYLTDIGLIKKIDDVEKRVIMKSGMRIDCEQIVDIEYLLDNEY